MYKLLCLLTILFMALPASAIVFQEDNKSLKFDIKDTAAYDTAFLNVSYEDHILSFGFPDMYFESKPNQKIKSKSKTSFEKELNGKQVKYKDVFGNGTNIEYKYNQLFDGNTRLKENIYVPEINIFGGIESGDNLIIDYTVAVSGLTFDVDGAHAYPDQNLSVSGNVITFYADGFEYATLPRPYYLDSQETIFSKAVYGYYKLYTNNNKLHISIIFEGDKLVSAIYPIHIDPTIDGGFMFGQSYSELILQIANYQINASYFSGGQSLAGTRNHLYISQTTGDGAGNYNDTISIVNISNLSNPVIVGRSPKLLSNPRTITVNANETLLFGSADFRSEAFVLNITNKSSPTILDELVLDADSTSGSSGVASVDAKSVVYITQYNPGTYDATGKLYRVSVADPSNIYEMNSYQGYSMHDVWANSTHAISLNYGFCGITTFDVSDNSIPPVPLDNYSDCSPMPSPVMMNFSTASKRLYIASLANSARTHSGGLAILDLSNFSDIRSISNMSSNEYPDIAYLASIVANYDETKLFITAADPENSIYSINITNVSAPHIEAKVHNDGYPVGSNPSSTGLAFVENYFYYLAYGSNALVSYLYQSNIVGDYNWTSWNKTNFSHYTPVNSSMEISEFSPIYQLRTNISNPRIKEIQQNSFNLTTSNFSLFATVKTNSSYTWEMIAGTGGYATGYEHVYRLVYNNKNASCAILRRNPDGAKEVDSFVRINDGQSHEVGCVRIQDNLYVYVDGKMKNYVSGVSAYMAGFTNGFYIGRPRDYNQSYSFNGSIKNVKLYNYALNNSSVAQNYNYSSIQVNSTAVSQVYNASESGEGFVFSAIEVKGNYSGAGSNWSLKYKLSDTDTMPSDWTDLGTFQLDKVTNISRFELTTKKAYIQVALNGTKPAGENYSDIITGLVLEAGNTLDVSDISVNASNNYVIVNFTVGNSSTTTHINYSKNPNNLNLQSDNVSNGFNNRSVNLSSLDEGTKYYYSVWVFNSTEQYNTSVYNFTTGTFVDSITNLQSTVNTTSINWTWTQPLYLGFNHVYIKVNNTWVVNTSLNYYSYLAGGHTTKTVSIQAVDVLNVMNLTQINNTNTTENSIPSISIQPANNSTVSNIQINVTVSDSDNDNVSSVLDFNRTLKYFWTFNNATGYPEDISDSGNNGTFYNGTTTPNLTSGFYGNGLYFDGVDDYINTTEANLNTSNLTIMMKITPDDITRGGGNTLVCDRLFSNDWCFGTNAGRIQLYGWNDTAAVVNMIGNTTLLNNSMTVGATYNGTHIYLYVNGTSDNNSYNYQPIGYFRDLTKFITVGFMSPSWSGRYYKGSITDLVIDTGRAWTPDEAMAYSNDNNYITNLTGYSDGYYNYTVYAQDSYGGINSLKQYLTLDATPVGATEQFVNRNQMWTIN